MNSSDQSVLKVRDLQIGYGAKCIARDISFDLNVAQVLCLLGPNGSGKSTLFKTVLGLIPSLTGSIDILAKPVSQCSRREIAKAIAYVPQQSSEMFGFTALDMVLMGRNAYIGMFSAPSKSDRDIAMHSLERLGIGHLAKRLFPQMSGGEQQLVLLARALSQEPNALILDEPTASLDFGNQILVIEQVQQLKAQGLSIFLCTHQPEHAIRMADEVLLLANGQVFNQGPTADVLTMTNLAAMYGLSEKRVRDYLKTRISKSADAFQ